MSSKLTRVLKAPDIPIGSGRASVRAVLECLHNDTPTVSIVLEKWVPGAGAGDQEPVQRLALNPKEIVDLKTHIRGIIEHAFLLEAGQAKPHGFEQLDCYVEALEGKLRIYPDRVIWGEVGETTPVEAVEVINQVGGLVEAVLKVPTMHHSVAAYVSHY